MKIRHRIIKFGMIPLICLFLATSPLLFSIIHAFNLPKQYDETYLAAMSDKMKLLDETEGKRVVLTGGSSMAFGIDSELLSSKLEQPVINFGLYAGIGSKITLDLLRSGLRKDDIVIFALEYSTQTYTNYINAESTLQMLDADRSLAKHMKIDDMMQIVGSLSTFSGAKREFIRLERKPTASYPYSRDSFNEIGDIRNTKPYNIMPDMYDTTNLVEINTKVISQDFIDYFNSFAKWAKRKGITVMFSFPPVNELAIVDKNEDTILEFYDFIEDNFDAHVISNIHDYIIHQDYFYDTNYHLNNSGVVLRTDRLLSDIKRFNLDTSANGIDVPEGSGSAGQTDDDDDDIIISDEELFEYDIANERVTITGLSSKAAGLTDVVVPSKIENLPVYKIEEGAFSNNSAIQKLTIPSSVQTLSDKLFENSPNLTTVYLLLPSNISNPLPQVGGALLEGANPSIKIYVQKNWYSIITSGYFWGQYANSIYVID